MPSSSSVSPSSAKKSQTPKAKRKAKKKEDEAKKKAEEEEEEENEAEFQKALLEIRVNELETLNLGLKRKCDYLEGQNDVYKVQLQETREEREELVAYLERSWKDEKSVVKALEEKLLAVQQTLGNEIKNSEEKLLDKELENEEMKGKLEKEISDLGSQLIEIEDFRIQKDELNLKFENLEKAFDAEKKLHQVKYEELENELIRYKEDIRRNAVKTLMEIVKDVQAAGKLCLTDAVKTTIAANVKLRVELEIVSKDNLKLRRRLETLSLTLRQVRTTAIELENLRCREKRKSEEYKNLMKLLLDKQCQLNERIEKTEYIENTLTQLQHVHSLCKTDEEINQLIQIKIAELNKKYIKINDDTKADTSVKAELKKLQDLIVKVAITAKEITEAKCQEEYEFLMQRYKTMIVKVYEAACTFPNQSQQLKSRLIISAPNILPYFTFR